MPIVDYNRIYKVRSRERQPVIYSPNMVPDRAGATIRAGMHALNARLADAESRAREKQGNLRAQFAAIGNLIGVGAKVGDAYARAVERRDQADFDALAAAWQTHMNNGAEQAYRRPYVRGGENGEGADGPMRAIEELDSSFDQSDAFQNARDGVKERFAAWRAKSRIPYANKAAQRQSDLNDLYQKNALEARFASADGKIATFYGIGEHGSFNDAVEEKVDAAVARTAWEYERIGAVLPESERARIAGGIREKALFDRAKFRCEQYAAGDTVPTEDDEALLSAARELSQDGSAITDDTMRLALKNTEKAAVDSRNRNIEAVDTATQKKLVDAAADLVGKTEAAEPSEVFKFADDATAAAMNIRDESKRATALKRIDGAVGIVEFDNWAGDLKDALEAFDEGDPETGRSLLDGVTTAISTMRSESGKAMAQQALAGAFKGRREDIGRKVSEVLERGWYFDRETGHWEPLTREQALDLFQTNIVFMDQDAREKARKALDKGRPRMTADSIAALNTFLGANQAQNLFDWDKVGASEDGGMAYAPKDDWGKSGTIDIWNGRRDMDVDRAMAQKIWTIAERWQDLMRSGAVKPDSKGRFPTLDQYLDQQLKDDAEWRNWRDATIAERVEKTMELLDTQVDSMFFATPNQ